MIKARDPVRSRLSERNGEGAMARSDLALEGCTVPCMAWKGTRPLVEPSQGLMAGRVRGSLRIVPTEERGDLDGLTDPRVI
jgi:hypothetical protein